MWCMGYSEFALLRHFLCRGRVQPHSPANGPRFMCILLQEIEIEVTFFVLLRLETAEQLEQVT